VCAVERSEALVTRLAEQATGAVEELARLLQPTLFAGDEPEVAGVGAVVAASADLVEDCAGAVVFDARLVEVALPVPQDPEVPGRERSPEPVPELLVDRRGEGEVYPRLLETSLVDADVAAREPLRPRSASAAS
jgi:hypothetical protein